MDITTTATSVSEQPAPHRRVYPPVGKLGLLLAGLISLWLGIFRGAEARRIFVRRCELSRQRIEDKKEFRRLKKGLEREAREYAKLIQLAYTQLGQRSDRRWDGVQTNEKGKRKRIAKVEFHKIFTDSDVMWFKILTRKRGLLGTRAMLPYGVRVENLVDETAHHQLRATLERDVMVTSSSSGVWVRVFRLQGTDGIPRLVTFREVLDKYANPAEMAQGKIILGVGDRKIAHHFYLEDNPHVLVGGATKTGKSNWVNNLISALIRFLTPAQLQLTLIDLKLVEFNFYEDIPHLHVPIVFALKDVLTTLIEIRKEMFRRAELFKQHKCKNLYVWNTRYPNDILPRHVVIIDEFAEVVNGDDKDLCDQIFKQCRSISSLGRALGIHIVICTQRPSAQIVPMDIKNNAAVRIGGRTGDFHASRVIMDTGDLATLEDVKGRMIYKIGADRFKIQTPLITDDDIEECVAIAKGRASGVIDLSGIEPVINSNGLTRWIIQNNDGSLAFTPLYAKLKPLAITRDMLQAYLKDIGKQVQLDNGTRLEVVVAGNTRKLVIPNADLPESAEKLFDEQDKAIEAALTDYAMPILPEPPAPVATESEIVLSEPKPFDQYDEFLNQACIRQKGTTVLANELYLAYQSWCIQLGYIPESNTRFGKAMSQKADKKHTDKGRIYINLTLQPTIQAEGSEGLGSHTSQEEKELTKLDTEGSEITKEAEIV